MKKLKRYDAEERSIEERRSDRAHWWAQVFIIVCLLGVAAWAHFIQVGRDHDATRIARVAKVERQVAVEQATEARKLADQRLSLINACNRLNTVRRSDNAAHLGSYVLYDSVITLTRLSPLPPPTPRARVLANERFLARLSSARDAQSWTPIQDCTRVVDSKGFRFQVPNPIAFSVRLPPSSALLLPPTVHSRPR